MPKKLSKDEINERLEKLYLEKEKAVAYRDSLPAKTLERNKATNKISTIYSAIVYFTKKPEADKKFKDRLLNQKHRQPNKKLEPIPISYFQRIVSNEMNKQLERIKQKADKLIASTDSEKEKKTIREMLYYTELRAKYSCC